MSKKSRKRNKKILTILGLAAAATAASRRNKGTAADANDGFRTKSNKSVSVGGGQTYAPTPKVVLPKVKPIVDTAPVNKNTFRTRGRITDSAGNTIASAGVRPDKMPNTPPPSIGDPYSTRTGTGARRFGTVNYRKDGGRATYKSGGAAKRGVSPILLKGKK